MNGMAGAFCIWHVGRLPFHAFGGPPTLTCWPAGPRMRSGIVVALPLTAVSSQFVIGSFEARFFSRAHSVGQTFLSVVLGHIQKRQTGMPAPRRLDKVSAHGP